MLSELLHEIVDLLHGANPGEKTHLHELVDQAVTIAKDTETVAAEAGQALTEHNADGPQVA